MNHLPVDAAQREQALDSSRSFIVQAPAGSGKTELLTQRYLKLLAQVERPERILAITFTRKATREMRARIEKRLLQASSDATPENAHEKRAIEFARLALARDAELGWSLLRNPSRMRILTIDGLCAQYLARDPGAAGTGAGMAVQEDASPLYAEAIERLFEHLGSVPEAGDDWSAARQALTDVLVHLDGNAQQLRELLQARLASRDQWVHRLGSDPASLMEVLEARQQFELDEFVRALHWPDYQRAGLLVSALGATVESPDHPAARYHRLGHAGEAGGETGILKAWNFSRVFLTTSGLRSPKFDTRAFKGMDKSLQPQLDQLKEIYGGWMEQPAARAALLRMAKSPPLELDPNARELQQSIVTVLQYALAELRVLFAERAQCDFHHVTEAALQSLGEDNSPGALLLAEDLRLEHILMDEFQDTSNTQFELLHRLVSGWEETAGGQGRRSLFLVGDPMQSIYRFREANVGLFIDVVEQGRLGDVPLNFLQLQANFRSRPELVDWVNPQFQQIFPQRDKSDAGAVRYAMAVAATTAADAGTTASPSAGAEGSNKTVQVHPFAPATSHRQEAEFVLELVAQARQDLGDPSIAILTRTRSNLAEIAALLQERGVEYEAVKVGELQQRPVIQDLLSITRALRHPSDRPAWLAMMRAPWCGLTVAEMHQVVGNSKSGNLLQRLEEGEPLADPGADARVVLLAQVMRRAVENLEAVGLRDSVEQAWRALGGPLCYASPGEAGHATVYFRLLENLEAESNERLVERMQDRLGKLYAGSRSARLQLMPIHQAKGLEFDVVIIPRMHHAPRVTDSNLVELQEFRLAGGYNATLMAPLPSRQKPEASLYTYLQAVDRERSGYETQRVLYVACTRARHRLHLLGRFRESKDKGLYAPKGSLMELLFPAFESASQAAVGTGVAGDAAPASVGAGPAANPREAADPIPFPLLRLRTEALPALDPALGDVPAGTAEPIQWRPLPNRNAAALGQAVHDWLELLHDHWGLGWNEKWFAEHHQALESSLIDAGAAPPALPQLLIELEAILTRILNNESSRELLSPEGKTGSWAELPLLRRDGNRISRHIIDRLYEEKGAFTIIDYKTGADSDQTREQWISQLQRYRRLCDGLESSPVSGTLVLQANDNKVIDLSRETAETE
jgi:ATP-dependent helicase/nuclease subunit A